IWVLRHAFEVVRGKYDDPDDEGEVSHFRALTSALSATVGLGNIAGVAIAISMGGPGAVFWMTIAGFLGMAAKFTECTLGQMYRKVNPDGTISGGPMYYLSRGLAEKGGFFVPFGKVLAIMAAVMVMGAALGGGNMFQVNQAWAAISYTIELDPENQFASSIFGILMLIMVGIVIIGGIRRIGAATARIVPIMAAIYVLGAMVVLAVNYQAVPSAFATIVRLAFTNEGVAGGFLGILITGFRRAAFSSEAGLGSASIAHAAAKTKEPVREGFVALLEPFIDTVLICNITALVIVVTGAYLPEATEHLPEGFFSGVLMTKIAFESVMPWFPWVLTACVVLFAYSTMIAWCYYGERGWIYLFDHFGEGTGIRTVIAFRLTFVAFVYIGVVASLDAVIDFSDAMLLSMAFPNIIGCVILLPMLKRTVDDYWQRYKGGQMPMHSATLLRQLKK
ncbi:MAG: alanine:cation symporter family protein, partial [Candidatus Sumerlaeia bacterium]|nr:alanine:cation symporter family protein [Candidatus Sumerlaeia bacterium]